MANELQVLSGLVLRDGDATTEDSSTVSVSPSAKKAITKTVAVTTTAAALDFTGLTAARYIKLKNLDGTNYVDVGPDNGGTMVGLIRLLSGDTCTLPLKPSTTIKAQANTATCNVQMMAVDT